MRAHPRGRRRAPARRARPPARTPASHARPPAQRPQTPVRAGPSGRTPERAHARAHTRRTRAHAPTRSRPHAPERTRDPVSACLVSGRSTRRYASALQCVSAAKRASNSASVISLARAPSEGATRSAPDNSSNVLAACARAAEGASELRQIACKVKRASSTGSVTSSRLVSLRASHGFVEGRRARRAVMACLNPAWAGSAQRRAA